MGEVTYHRSSSAAATREQTVREFGHISERDVFRLRRLIKWFKLVLVCRFTFPLPPPPQCFSECWVFHLSQIILLLPFFMMTLSSHACSLLLLCSHIPGCLPLSCLLFYCLTSLACAPVLVSCGLSPLQGTPCHPLTTLTPPQWNHCCDAHASPLSLPPSISSLPPFFFQICVG